MLSRTSSAVVLGALLTWVSGSGAQEAPSPSAEPQASGLVEKTEIRLVQIEVVVSGPAAAMEDLGMEDFELYVNRRHIERFTVDRLRESVPGIPETERPATYVFYFDQSQLTSIAREQSLDLAREIVPRVITGIDRGMVVSAGRDLKVYAGPTTSAEELLEAIDLLDGDAEQRDAWGASEQLYAAVVEQGVNDARDLQGLGGAPGAAFGDQASLDFLSARGVQNAQAQADAEAGQARARKQNPDAIKPTGQTNVSTGSDKQRAVQESVAAMQAIQVQGRANVFKQDALWHTQHSLERLRAFLVRLYDVDRPKSIVYFADLLRFEPGEAFLTASGQRDSLRGVWSFFEEVRDAASAHGIRFYTVDGRGLVGPSDKEVQDGLSYFALESGGRAFLHGVAGDRIAGQMLDDLSSTYLLSFDAGVLPSDRAVFMTVTMKSPQLAVLAPAHLYIESAEARTRSDLLAAYIGSDNDPDDAVTLSAALIPIGYAKGKFRALVQVSTMAADTERSTWDMGATLVSRGKVREKISKRITVGASGVPVTFEREMEFGPGPYEVVAVAHQIETDSVVSGRVVGTWPVLEDQPAVIGPIAVVQPSQRVIVRNDAVRKSGTLAIPEGESVRTDRPTGFVTVVCGDPRAKSKLVVLRTVGGETISEFDPLEIEPSRERCAVLTDVIPNAALRAGTFTYTVEVRCGDESCATAEREFSARHPGL